MITFYLDHARNPERYLVPKGVWNVGQVSTYTGYNCRAVGNWIRKGRLHTILRTHKYFIPKRFLIDYLCSAEYWNIIRKSRQYVDTLWAIHAFSKVGSI